MEILTYFVLEFLCFLHPMKFYNTLISIFCLFLLSFSANSQSLNADFNASRTSGCAPLVVSFSDVSQGNATSWLWDFGNGNTSTLQNPGVTFTNPGNYTVTLTISNGMQNSTETKTAYITVYSTPSPQFTADKQLGCSPFQVQFTDQTTPANDIVSYQWDFGDGSISTQKNPTHTYTTDGKFNVTLVVVDKNGCSNTLRKDQYIDVELLNLDFSVNSQFSCVVPATFSFEPIFSSTGTLTYQWDFGDGDFATLEKPNHTYTTTGKKTVKLKVTSPRGCTKEITKTDFIEISDISGTIKTQNQSYCAPAIVNFNFESNISKYGNLPLYEWDFGNGTTTTNRINNIRYETPGTYDVKLKITFGGCVREFSSKITIKNTPTIDIKATNQTVCNFPSTATFVDNSPNIIQRTWFVDDVNVGSGKTLSVPITGPGSKTIKVTLLNSDSCLVTQDLGKIVGEEVTLVKNHKKQNGCVPLNVNLDYGLNGDAGDIDWTVNIKGLNTFKTPKVSIAISDPKTYLVEVTAKSSSGCSYTLLDTFWAGKDLVVDATNDKDSGCRKDMSVIFTGTVPSFNFDTNYSEIKHIWSFSDGTIFKLQNFRRSFTDTGKIDYTYQIEVNGCKSNIVKGDVYIYAPVVKISTLDTVCLGQSIELENASIITNMDSSSFYWVINQKDTLREWLPTYNFNQPGTYELYFYLYDSITQCFDEGNTKVEVISESFNIGFQFDYFESCGTVNRPFTLTGDTDKIFNVIWNFSNGKSFESKSFVAEFREPGEHFMNVAVYSRFGCKVELKDTLVGIISGMDAKARWLNPEQCTPEIIQLYDSSTGNAEIFKREWILNNEHTIPANELLTEINLSFLEFSNIIDGKISVVLKITDLKDCEYTDTFYVPFSRFDISVDYKVIERCLFDEIEFSVDLSKINLDDINNFTIEVNGEKKTNTTSIVTTADKGQEVVYKVTIVDVNLCENVISGIIPASTFGTTIDFNASNRNSTCPPLLVSFTATNSGAENIVSWEWDFGDSTTSLLQNPEKIYGKSGVFDVTLKATDANGCVYIKTKKKYVILRGPSAVVNYTLNPANGCEPLTARFIIDAKNVDDITWDMGDGRFIYTDGNTKFIEYIYPYRANPFIPNVFVRDKQGCEVSYQLKPISVNPKPIFEIDLDYASYCIGEEITLNAKFPDNITPNNIVWKIDDSLTLTGLNPKISLINPKAYDVEVQVETSKGCINTIFFPNAITVFYTNDTPNSVEIHRVSIEDNNILLEFEKSFDPFFRGYRVFSINDDGSANQVVFSKRRDDTAVLISSLNPMLGSYCFQVQVINSCNISSTLSQKHCTVHLDVDAINESLVSNWTNYTGWEVDSFILYRDNRIFGDSSLSYLATLTPNTFSYIDSIILCKQDYTYRITAFKKNEPTIYSNSNLSTNQSEKTKFTTAPNVRRVTVENDEFVRVEWEKDSINQFFVSSYNVYKAKEFGNFSLVQTLDPSADFYNDYDVNVDNHWYRYYLTASDNCGARESLPKSIHKTILLKTYPEDFKNQLVINRTEWDYYEGWPNGVEIYDVEFNSATQGNIFIPVTSELPSSFHTARHSSSNIYQDDYCYRIKAVSSEDNNIISYSNVSCLPPIATLFCPNAFSPNVNIDDLNNQYFCKGAFISDFSLKIYDRWGELIFETDDINEGWDGTFRGKDVMEGVFIYIATGFRRNTKPIVLKGNITVIK